MTIEKGKEWGTQVVVPEDAVFVNSDKVLATQTRDSVCIVTDGDLWRTLGEPALKSIGATATVVPIDALEVEIEWNDNTFVIRAASSIEIGTWWSFSRPFSHSRYIAISNCGILSGLNISPRAHPNDGLVDILQLDAAMNTQQRFMSRRRAKTGSHVPHPHISTTRADTVSFTKISRAEPLRIDGDPIHGWTSISVRVVSDFWRVII